MRRAGWVGQAAIAAVVAVLLGAAARPSGPVVESVTHCAGAFQSSGGGFLLNAYPPARFFQPVEPGRSIAEVDLDLVTTERAAGHFRISWWDPATLAPAANLVALRSRSYMVSHMAYGGLVETFAPPVVTRTIAGLAEAPPQTVAIDYQLDMNYYGATQQDIEWDAYADPAIPLAYVDDGVQKLALPGPHGVLSHAVCAGSGDEDQLFVCQSVVRADSVVGVNQYAVAQKFRVIVPTRLHWVEMAFSYTNSTSPYPSGYVAILDAELYPTLPVTPGSTLALAAFYAPQPNSWGGNLDFDQDLVLEPDRDYWLWIGTSNIFRFHTRESDGTENGNFTTRIGSFWTQTPEGTWTYRPRHALNFRVIGEPLSPTGVGEGPARAGSLRIAAVPNPARGRTVIQWAGASGALEIDLYDPAGRRVLSQTTSGEAAGRWTWRATGERGALEAGMYFVRARDQAGQSASLRVAIVR